MVAAFRARTGVARQGRSSEWMFGHTLLHLQGGNGGTGVVTRWRGREGQYSWRRSGRQVGMIGGEGIETAACKLQKIQTLAILQIYFLFYRFYFLFYRFYFTDLILQIWLFILQIFMFILQILFFVLQILF